ncbi:MAG TPA: cyclase family protein [Burkholderiales bacterium]|nr:cyclase family protein [Burkholderiales bacterium]
MNKRILAAGLIAASCLYASAGVAQSWTPPTPEARCPSKWGAADERGAANLVTAESVLAASKLIRSGEVIELGRVLSVDMPLFGTRRFDIHTKRTGGPMGTNKRYTNEEIVFAEIGQVGTQFDMFSHQSIDNKHYNCFATDEISTRNGFTKLGVEKIGSIYTRGVLIDVAAAKGVDMLEGGYEITAKDLQDAIAKQGISLKKGDAVLIHTGFGKLWGVDNAKYNGGTPGIGVGAAEFLAKGDPVLFGADTYPVEVNPNPDKNISLPIHQLALSVYGIFLLENMKLDELAAKKVYEFALVVQPLKIKGGTGSTVAPIAIR